MTALKPMRVRCVVCEVQLPPVMVGGNMHEAFAMLGLCDEHYEPPEPERDLEREFQEADVRIQQLAVAGLLVDSRGEVIEPV